MSAKITFKVNLPVKIKKSGKWFIAGCDVLDLITQGETREIAKVNLEDAIALFFATCYDKGTLESVLKNCGFPLTDISQARLSLS